MHILTVNTLYPPHVIGGAELGIHHLSKAMVAAGHRVDVVTLGPPGAKEPAVQTMDGVRVHRLSLANLYWPYQAETKPTDPISRIGWHLIDTGNPVMAARVARLVKDIQPDVVVTQNLQGFSTLVIPRVARLGVPVVHVLHDFSLLCPRTAMYRNGASCGSGTSRCGECRLFTAPRAGHLEPLSGVIGVSDSVLRLHEDHGLFRQMPRRVIHNALRDDLPLRDRPREAAGDAEVVFGFIGRVDRPKGIETLLAAAEQAHKAGRRFRLKIAGRGEKDYIEYLRQRWPLPDVEYLGFTSPVEFYRAIDVLVFPSDSREALGNVVIEAYSQGVPVIATNSGGAAETVVPGTTGFLTAPGDSLHVARCMITLCDKPALRAELALAALAHASGYLIPSRVSAYLEALQQFRAGAVR